MKKKTITTLAMAMAVAAGMAKDIKTIVFTTKPQMHCENCENKIKGNIRFEKGIKKIETNIDNQEVTITFDADKTSVEKLQDAFDKIGYEASIVDTNAKNADKQSNEQAEK